MKTSLGRVRALACLYPFRKFVRSELQAAVLCGSTNIFVLRLAAAVLSCGRSTFYGK